MNTLETLNILQYTVGKPKDTVMAPLLRDTRAEDFDIIPIQEPQRNPSIETTHYLAEDMFHLCYPSSSQDEPARACLVILQLWCLLVFVAYPFGEGSLTLTNGIPSKQVRLIFPICPAPFRTTLVIGCGQ